MLPRIRTLIIAASAIWAIPACTGSDHAGVAVAAGRPDFHGFHRDDGHHFQRTASAGFNPGAGAAGVQ